MNKTLILYYSFEGSTKKVAEHMAEKLEMDIEEIKPKEEIKSKGFGKYVWGGRQVLMGKKPEIKLIKSKLDDYENILIGSPIWAGTFAPAIKTLLENDYLRGKNIGYFYCHEGGAAKAVEKAKKVIEKNNIYLSSVEFVNVKKKTQDALNKAIQWASALNLK